MTRLSYHQNDSSHHAPSSIAASATIREFRDSMGFGTAFFLALLTHVGTVLMFFLIYAILVLFLKINIPFFQPLQTKQKDIEFVLVDNNKPQPPRNKNTKHRSDKMSRSGGTKIKNMPEAVPQRAAGRPTPKPQPARQAVKPTPRPQPPAAKPQVVQRPMPKPTPMALPVPAPPTPKPAPQKAAPAPKLPTHAQVSSPISAPSPVTPNIKIPMPASNPQAVATGPVVSSTSGPRGSRGGGGGSTGVIGPQAIPGSLSRGSSAGNYGGSGSRGGQMGGNGGTGSMNQSGSPGGGGGRPGIDAMPEPDFGPYISELQRRIRRNWTPPSSDRSKRVVTIITIGRQGQLINLRIKVSSGSGPADAAALDAVRASAPFRPLPVNLRQSSIDVEFTFDYDVYNGGGSGRIR